MPCKQVAISKCKGFGVALGCPSGYSLDKADKCPACLYTKKKKPYACVPGRRAVCSRPCSTSDECCVKGTPPKGRKCDSSYTTLSSKCNAAMIKYCTGTKMFTDKRCKTWCTNNNQACVDTVGKICNSKVGAREPKCLSWCVDNPGKCDDMARVFCQNPRNHRMKFCSCFSSPLNKGGALVGVAECQDKKCTSVGSYKRAAGMDIVRGGCPSIITCKQKVDASAIDKARIDIGKINQKCIINNKEIRQEDKKAEETLPQDYGSETTTEERTQTRSGGKTSTTPLKDTKKSDNTGKIVFFVLFFITLVFAVILTISQIKDGPPPYRVATKMN